MNSLFRLVQGRALRTTLVLVIVAGYCVPGLVNAQDGGPPTADKDAEILRLKEQLRAAERQIEQAEKAGFLAVDNGYASAQEILRLLPDDLKLNAAKPWDEFQWKRVNEFLQQNVVGKPFGSNLKVAKVEIETTQGAPKDPALPKFTINILFSVREFPLQGVLINQQIYNLHPLTFRGDDELAERARSIKVGKTYELRGVIAEIDVRSVIGKPNEKDVKIRLANIEFEPFAK